MYQKKIFYTDDSKDLEFEVVQIGKIVLHLTLPLKNGYSCLPFEQYHYAQITTKDDETVYVTCLVCEEIRDICANIKPNDIKEEIRDFPFIKRTASADSSA